MARRSRIAFAIFLCLGLALAAWWWWPRSNVWRPTPPAPPGNLIVQLEFTADPMPPLPLELERWKPVKIELERPGQVVSAGVELADRLKQLARPDRQLALLASGPAGWIALEALIAGAPVSRLVLLSSSATGECAARTQLEPLPLHFRLTSSRVDLRERLRSVVVPTLAISGADLPPAAATCVETLALSVAGTRLERLPGTGLEVARQAPDQVAALITGFLR